VPPSRRLQAGALLFVFLMTLSLWLAPGLPWGWRLLAGLAGFSSAWKTVGTILFQCGPGAVRRFVWAADGRWRIRSRAGDWANADISSRTAALGPWILLVWKPTPREGGRDGRRASYALIDAGYVSRSTFRALRGRLKLALSRPDPK
jgi:hypothetical protein